MMSDSFLSSDRWVACPATPEGMLDNNPPLAVVVVPFRRSRFRGLAAYSRRTRGFKSARVQTVPAFKNTSR